MPASSCWQSIYGQYIENDPACKECKPLLAWQAQVNFQISNVQPAGTLPPHTAGAGKHKHGILATRRAGSQGISTHDLPWAGCQRPGEHGLSEDPSRIIPHVACFCEPGSEGGWDRQSQQDEGPFPCLLHIGETCRQCRC